MRAAATARALAVPQVRCAAMDELDQLNALIQRSMRVLGKKLYTVEELETVLSIVGADEQLIRDETYYVIDGPTGVIACGGWSYREKLFGGDTYLSAPRLLDPAHEPARIRAFFVDPAYAGQSLGTLLLETCEREARRMGFRTMALASTRPGEAFYHKRGYHDLRVVEATVHGHAPLKLMEMMKQIA